MAGKARVTVYFEDNSERALARDLLEDAVVFDALAVGLADESAIRRLTENGLVVAGEPAPMPAPPAEVVSRYKRTDPVLQTLASRMESIGINVEIPKAGFLERLFTPGDLMASMQVYSGLGVVPLIGAAVGLIGNALRGTPGDDVYRVRFRGPLRPEWERRLAEQKIQLLSYRRGTYQTFLTPEQIDWLRHSEMIEEVKRYDVLDTVHTALLMVLEAKRETPERRRFELMLHRASDRRRVEAAIRHFAGKRAIVESSHTAIRFDASLDETTVAVLARLPWVRSLLPYRPPRLFSSEARVLIGLPPVPQAGAFRWNGANEIVAVIDSGIDRTHRDVAPQLFGDPVSFEQAPVDDLVGHGTHVAGIIAGTGEESKDASGTPNVCGVAPGAKLVVVANVVLGEDGPLPKIPLEIERLFDLAVSRGATIINASWGTQDENLLGVYDATAEAVDRYVWDNPEVLVVVAAGNRGRAPQGFCAFKTLASPATAKSVLTVGACASSRTDFGETWGTREPELFPTPNASLERVAGDPELIAAISSRGPTEYQSVKPDIVAPGTYILAPRAANIVDGRIVWRKNSMNLRYVFIGGTSMAAPVASASAAIVRQYLREDRGVPKPSAALLKSILIGAARRIRGSRDAGQTGIVGFPDFDQGFGRVDLHDLFPAGAPAARAMAFDDVANAGGDALKAGTKWSYSIFVSEDGHPLTVTLAWTDWPGHDVQNLLALEVRFKSRRFTGNATHVYGKKSSLPGVEIVGDAHNTVQQVRIDAASAGEYIVRVTAERVLRSRQGYAVSVIGKLKTTTFTRLKS